MFWGMCLKSPQWISSYRKEKMSDRAELIGLILSKSDLFMNFHSRKHSRLVVNNVKEIQPAIDNQ